MRNNHANGWDADAVLARVEPRLRFARGVLAHVLPRPDLVVLGACLWLAGYLAFAVAGGRGTDGHSSVSDLWLVPSGLGVFAVGLVLASNGAAAARDRLPWQVMSVAGLAMAATDVMWVAADEPSSFVSRGFLSSPSEDSSRTPALPRAAPQVPRDPNRASGGHASRLRWPGGSDFGG